MLISHKFEIEHFLTALFSQRAPADVGNDYIILGDKLQDHMEKF